MKHASVFALAVSLIIGAAGGYWAGSASAQPAYEGHAETQDDNGTSSHPHEGFEVPAGVPAPTLALEVAKDAVGGWNVRLVTEHFRFAPERASENHVMGEGHAHINVDGKKVGRIYGEWYHLGALPEGEHVISVSLATNDHKEYRVSGEAVQAETVVTEAAVAMGAERTVVLEVRERTLLGETTFSVKKGDIVTLRIVSDEAEEFHVHGYDRSVELVPGQEATLTFQATLAGRFAFELEESKTELGALEVRP
jgi:hypothetical protein